MCQLTYAVLAVFCMLELRDLANVSKSTATYKKSAL